MRANRCISEPYLALAKVSLEKCVERLKSDFFNYAFFYTVRGVRNVYYSDNTLRRIFYRVRFVMDNVFGQRTTPVHFFSTYDTKQRYVVTENGKIFINVCMNFRNSCRMLRKNVIQIYEMLCIILAVRGNQDLHTVRNAYEENLKSFLAVL